MSNITTLIFEDPEQELWADGKTYLVTGELYMKRGNTGPDDHVFFCTCPLIATMSRGKQVQIPVAAQCLIDLTTGTLWTHVGSREQAEQYILVSEVEKKT